MISQIENSWKKVLHNYLSSAHFTRTRALVEKAYAQTTVYPTQDKVFKALELTPFDKVRVVILGQDPYIRENQAVGLAFSVQEGVTIPPSLLNIFKEIHHETGSPSICSRSGDLSPWAKQGVLLLNSVLTVEAQMSASHSSYGWNILTDEIICEISKQHRHVVFMLWGTQAQRKASLIDSNKHLVLVAPHPSPLSAYRGFFDCGHFTYANDYLRRHGYLPIEW